MSALTNNYYVCQNGNFNLGCTCEIGRATDEDLKYDGANASDRNGYFIFDIYDSLDKAIKNANFNPDNIDFNLNDNELAEAYRIAREFMPTWEIKKNLEYNIADFEPVDNEGYDMRGMVEYNGRRFEITFSTYDHWPEEWGPLITDATAKYLEENPSIDGPRPIWKILKNLEYDLTEFEAKENGELLSGTVKYKGHEINIDIPTTCNATCDSEELSLSEVLANKISKLIAQYPDLEEQHEYIEDAKNADGCKWIIYEDGSGHFVDTHGDSYFSFDMATREMKDLNGEWQPFDFEGDWKEEKEAEYNKYVLGDNEIEEIEI